MSKGYDKTFKRISIERANYKIIKTILSNLRRRKKLLLIRFKNFKDHKVSKWDKSKKEKKFLRRDKWLISG